MDLVRIPSLATTTRFKEYIKGRFKHKKTACSKRKGGLVIN
jgi:hypothetical protein